jgi:recombination protein RecA
MYNEGISRTGSMLDLGIEHKILEKRGAWISFEGELIGQGRDAAKQALRDDPALAEKVTQAVLAKVNVKGGESVTGDGDTKEKE